MTYCTKKDVIIAYGSTAVHRWADLDNCQDETLVDERINWAIARATRIIDSRLRGGPYVIPFTDPYPGDIIDLASLQSGIILFDGRRIFDTSDPEDQVSAQRTEFDLTIRQIRAGQYQLDFGIPRTGNFPIAINPVISDAASTSELYPEGTTFRTVRERCRDGELA